MGHPMPQLLKELLSELEDSDEVGEFALFFGEPTAIEQMLDVMPDFDEDE